MNSDNMFKHIFISQTPSIEAIVKWTSKSIPFILRVPFLGQLSNQLLLHKLTNIWYDVALPRDSNKKSEFKNKAFTSLNQGGCFCLSSLTQGLSKDKNTKLNLDNTNISLIWGGKDFSHRNTAKESIRDHVSNCEIIEFDDCGHFPELERTERYVKLVNERLV